MSKAILVGSQSQWPVNPDKRFIFKLQETEAKEVVKNYISDCLISSNIPTFNYKVNVTVTIDQYKNE